MLIHLYLLILDKDILKNMSHSLIFHVTTAQPTLYANVIRGCCEKVTLIGITLQVRDCCFMWGCDGVRTIIRRCKGRMNSVSEGHQSDWHCRCLDITQLCKPPLHPPCVTDIRAVCTESRDKWQWTSVCAHRPDIRQEEPRSVLKLFSIVAFLCVLCLIQYYFTYPLNQHCCSDNWLYFNRQNVCY